SSPARKRSSLPAKLPSPELAGFSLLGYRARSGIAVYAHLTQPGPTDFLSVDEAWGGAAPPFWGCCILREVFGAARRLVGGGAGAIAAVTFGLLGAAPAAAQSTFGTDQNSCDRSTLGQVLSTSKGNLLGSAAGGALGGLLGSQFGKGGGNTVMTIVGVVGGALAGGYIGRSMDPTDQACVGQTLEHTPSNQTVAWHNPDNGSSYWGTPTSSHQDQGRQPF